MPQQDPAEIQREIEQTREELSHTLDAIADKVSPKRVAARGKAEARVKLADVQAQAQALPRERVAAAGGGLLAVVAMVKLLQRRRRRRALDTPFERARRRVRR